VVTRVTRVRRPPPRPRDAHKGTFGTVVVVAGSPAMLGAAILCARGALRGGAGLVRACLPAALRAPFVVATPAATTRTRTGAVAAWCEDATAIVAGPGLGASAGTRRLVRDLLAASRVPLVLDADALNVLAPLRRLRARAPVLLTPHPGEAGRLLARPAARVQAAREDAALELARRAGAIAVLKGAGTIVTDGERLFVNRTGNPGMATGGSGDVLSGLLGALLARGMEPFAAACLAVHAHGRAGDLVARRLSEDGLCAEDLPLAIAEVLR
jgi:NAD(P)H-hydrate epimerase